MRQATRGAILAALVTLILFQLPHLGKLEMGRTLFVALLAIAAIGVASGLIAEKERERAQGRLDDE